jgi:hypothetical protein
VYQNRITKARCACPPSLCSSLQCQAVGSYNSDSKHRMYQNGQSFHICPSSSRIKIELDDHMLLCFSEKHKISAMCAVGLRKRTSSLFMISLVGNPFPDCPKVDIIECYERSPASGWAAKSSALCYRHLCQFRNHPGGAARSIKPPLQYFFSPYLSLLSTSPKSVGHLLMSWRLSLCLKPERRMHMLSL